MSVIFSFLNNYICNRFSFGPASSTRVNFLIFFSGLKGHLECCLIHVAFHRICCCSYSLVIEGYVLFNYLICNGVFFL